VNLLAERVVTRRVLPLTVAELGSEPEPDDLLRFGGLPLVRGERGAAARIDLLEAYVETYLTQEIRAEALVRSLGLPAFWRLRRSPTRKSPASPRSRATPRWRGRPCRDTSRCWWTP
jgi:hypothetical protein